MPTPIFVCGAECGIAVAGTASAGTEHWSAVGNTGPTIATSGISMRSPRAFRHNNTLATGQTTLTHTFATAIGSPATAVGRFYVYFATLPSANLRLFTFGNGTLFSGVKYISSDSSIRAHANGTEAGSGTVIIAGKWYRIDVKVVFNTTHTADVSVDGVAVTQASLGGQSASTCTRLDYGAMDGSVSLDGYFDDLIVSGTSGDFPIGAGTIVGLYPNGDKTNSAASPTDGNGGHLFSATTDFGKGAGGAVATGAQNAEATSWQSLQNPLTTTIQTNFIADLLGASTEHMVWTHDAMPSSVASVNGVMLVATTHSAAATANNETMTVTDSAGGNGLVAWSLLDLSETTITVPIFAMATKPGGGAWTKATVDSCLIRWGDSSDVNPDPYLDGVCLEVDFVPGFIPRLPLTVLQAVQRAAVR